MEPKKLPPWKRRNESTKLPAPILGFYIVCFPAFTTKTYPILPKYHIPAGPTFGAKTRGAQCADHGAAVRGPEGRFGTATLRGRPLGEECFLFWGEIFEGIDWDI